MAGHPKTERTLVIVKPDGVQRALVGEIIKRFEQVGLKIAGLKIGMADKKTLWKHYNKDDSWFLKKGAVIAKDREAAGLPVDKEPIEYGKDIIRALEKFMTAGPVVFIALEGNQAVAVAKKLVGSTEPATSDVGTIRGDFTNDSYAISAIDDRAVRNLVHCTDNAAEAQGELDLWFRPEELLSYGTAGDRILYDLDWSHIDA